MRTVGYIGAFLGGAIAGAVVGLLIAPQEGKRTPLMISARNMTSNCRKKMLMTWLTTSKRLQQTS